MRTVIYVIIAFILIFLLVAYLRSYTKAVIVEESFDAEQKPETSCPPINFVVKDPNPWKVPYQCGPQGCGDVLWHYMEPRMLLTDNCLHCDQFSKDKLVNVPDGLESNLTSDLSSRLENPMISDNLSIPEAVHTMSGPETNGLWNPNQGCLLNKVSGTDFFKQNERYF